MVSWASLVLRLALGAIFILHGSQKVFAAFGGSGIQGFSGMLSGLGFSPATFWAYLAAYAELLGGICLVLGAYTRIAALLVSIVMLVAIFKVHLSKGFFLAKGGYEYALLILFACVALMLLGAGKYSLIKKL